jgi:hypothetical protein
MNVRAKNMRVCFILMAAASAVVAMHTTLADDVAESPANPAGERVLSDFSEGADLSGWRVQDDVVMGGRSKGAITVNSAGHAVFSGDVSLENNGGFSSIQWFFAPIDVSQYRTAVLRLKGDGNRYQFRVQSTRGQRHSYARYFETSGEWETIEIPMAEMYPVFRGNRLDLPNYPLDTLAHVRFLIGNGREESFRLEIDKISLK